MIAWTGRRLSGPRRFAFANLRSSIACAGFVSCNDEMDSSCDLVGI
jgi:hypothetical protein